MSPVEFDFSCLVGRYTKAKEYEKNRYASDTQENRENAEKTVCRILSRMSELWEQMTEGERQKYITLL